jgi:1,4-dihydroxy-6-naphthoate synthase
MLIVKRGRALPDLSDHRAIRDWLQHQRIAVPGKMTSAFLALKLFFLGEPMHTVVPFDQIFQFLRDGNADVGLIIHEGQLTYERDGFDLVLDLGAWWQTETGLPLPLGGNVIRKDLSPAERSEVNAILRESIRYGLEHRAAGVEHALPLGRGLDATLADRFIGMYVNDRTLDYGEAGRMAIREFLGRGYQLGFLPEPVELEFVQ